ncbi:MAG: thermonuclease family protein [Candidatus Methylomirabilis oxyfera]|nr:thermonuclease family protein [Candidatus Methylomirabilis oxyfera]
MNRTRLHQTVLFLVLSTALLAATDPAGLVPTVREVIDGDTIVLRDGRKVRYLGINAPEHGQPYAREATNFNRRVVSGVPVRLEFDQAREDRHGRLLAYVYVMKCEVQGAGCGEEALVSEQLLAEGLAHVFFMPPNIRYVERFLQVQERAKTAKKGMWNAVRGPLKITRIEPTGNAEEEKGASEEFVRIANVSDQSLDVSGYSIADRDGHRYDFPSAQLRPGYVLTLVTGEGKDRRDHAGPVTLYWNRRAGVWNDRGDTAYLRDPKGVVVDRFEYRVRTRRKGLHLGD